MTTMKAYTDLEQSKKLAVFLPIESADMRYEYPSIEKDEIQEPINGFNTSSFNLFKKIDSFIYFPCWSLAALIGVLPKTINFGYENNSTFVLKPLENGKYLADYYEVSSVKDNPVDACVDVIENLHERKML